MSARARGLVVALLALTASACASVQRMTTPVDDYAAYRRVRLAEVMGERLRLAADYLRERPSGAFAAELRALFDEGEAAYFDEAKLSREGTLGYLTYLPEGPHAAAATSLLAAWDTKLEEGETAALLRDARRTETMLAGAATQRQRVGETIFEALRALSDPSAYGVPLEATAPAVRRFIVGSDGVTWGRMPATTTRDLFFSVPTAMDRESRFVGLVVELATDGPDRVVRSGIVRGPDLFVHWLEADQMLALDPTDTGVRVRAARSARDRLEGFFEALLPRARCAPPVTPSGTVLVRACDGWTVEVVASGQAGSDDTITMTHRP